MKKNLLLIAFLCISFIANAQQKLTSPDGNLVMTFQVNINRRWSHQNGCPVYYTGQSFCRHRGKSC